MSPRPPIHFVVPMSGQGTRYRAAGYSQPKPLIPVNGVPMIERLLEKIPQAWPCTFVLAQNHADSGLAEILRALRPAARCLFIEEHKKGPGWAVRHALDGIPGDAPVLVSYCDYGLDWDPAAFERFVRASGCDACLVSYRGFHAHYLSSVTYAYSRMDGERVVEVREKGSFTADREAEFASCGAYYFGSGAILRQALDAQDAMGLVLNGESYTSLTVEALLRSRPASQVRVFEIPAFFQWGTPEDLRNYEFWECSMNAYSRALGQDYPAAARAAGSAALPPPQVLMPMAGKGSRFSGLHKTPKAFLPVDGVPMFRRAADSFRAAPNATVFVTLEEHRPHLEPLLKAGERCIWLRETPPGQALSVAAGMDALAPDRDIVVTACDHAIALDEAAFDCFRADPGCDIGIFTITGFPGAKSKPQSYAWVDAPMPSASDPFPLIKHVSVKAPLRDPANDPILIGSFWFRNRDVLRRGIEELQRQRPLVNGELYLDSVVNVLAAHGIAARIIPCAGFVCWGDPDAMAEALYWQEVFLGKSLRRRPRFPGVDREH